MTLEDLDKACNDGFARLDEMRIAGKEGSPEYMALLYKLRDLTRERLASMKYEYL